MELELDTDFKIIIYVTHSKLEGVGVARFAVDSVETVPRLDEGEISLAQT
jgi:hypothetical protein